MILLISKVLIRLSSAFKTLNLILLFNLKTSFTLGTLFAIKKTKPPTVSTSSSIEELMSIENRFSNSKILYEASTIIVLSLILFN